MAVVVKDDNIQIERLELGPFGTNAYLLICQKTRQSAVVDAPADAHTIIDRLKGTHPRYLLLTHSHMDHLGALSELRARLGVPLGTHRADSRRLASPPEIPLDDGDIISFGNIKLEVLHTPGHTAGSLCFKTGRYLISGDTLFPGGPGKTASPADLKQIIESIKNRIFVLPADTEIYPGHGEATTVKQAKEEFAVFAACPHDPNLFGDVLWLTS